MSDKIIAYKGMDENMCCRGKQYEIGKTYTENKAICCISGMHACENPLDVFQYYRPDGKNRFFEVECNGSINKGENDSKLACTELKVTGELSLAKFIRLSVQTTFERALNRAKKKAFRWLLYAGRLEEVTDISQKSQTETVTFPKKC